MRLNRRMSFVLFLMGLLTSCATRNMHTSQVAYSCSTAGPRLSQGVESP